MKSQKLSNILSLFLLIATIQLSAQVAITSDGSAPDNSAMLDVKSITKGFLPPRMSHAQMDSIVNPADGLLIYCIDCGNSGSGTLAMSISGVWYIFTPSCLVPLSPSTGIHVPTPIQVTWNWNPVSDATGYMWNTTNDYTTSTNLASVTTKTETGLTCNTTYTRYAWAYNACGNSTPLTLTQTTSLNPPASPTAGTHVPSATQIVWNWNTVPGATGYKWSTTNDLATATDMGTTLTKTETGLTCSTEYTRYIWAYSTCGISSPTNVSQSTSAISCPSSMTDSRDGQDYSTVIIGCQCWMKQNLNIGSKINASTFQSNNSIIEKYCYNNLESNCDIYGGMYLWAEMVQYLNDATNTNNWNPVPLGNVQGICPMGWHLPSDNEWCILVTYLDVTANCANAASPSLYAGGEMKEIGTVHFNPNIGATNVSGFTGLGGGFCFPQYGFNEILVNANFWTASIGSYSNLAKCTALNGGNTVFSTAELLKTHGFSVRCLKD